MAKQIGKLSALTVTKLKTPGLHADGNGLYLRVKDKTGTKSWAYRYMLNGKAREMGLGSLNTFSLAEARGKAEECRKLLHKGEDPINVRKAEKAEKRAEDAKAKTFRECGEAYVEAHKASWRNAKHAQQWQNTLESYAYPIIGDLSVQAIDVDLVLKVLEQKRKDFQGKTLWLSRPETASRLRGRIEVILDWATARKYRQGENPARWRGHFDNLLPRRSKVQRVKHQPAMPYQEIGDFLTSLKAQEGNAALALAFTIMTAARTGETIGAKWKEIDLKNKTWTVPAGRIKGGRAHRVPLSEPAMHILSEMKKQDAAREVNTEWVFPSNRKNKPLSNMALLMLLRRMEKPFTVHGFRSSFRDWAAEMTNFPREIAEASLAHASGDKVEASYLRTDHFEKRRQMMTAWGKYCMTASVESAGGNVRKLRAQ